MDDHAKRSSYQMIGLVVGTLVLLYFMCPLVYIWPVILLVGNQNQPPQFVRTVDRVFFPVTYLADHVPAYRAMLDEEKKWFDLD